MGTNMAALAAIRPDLRIQRHDSEAGAIASLTDPSGHLLFLYEPSPRAMAWPSGKKLAEILALPLESACASRSAEDAAVS